MGNEKRSDTGKEQKSGLPQISAMHVIIAVAVIVLAVIFIAKFGFGTDLISPSSGEMAIVKRPVTPVPTLIQNPAVKPVSSIRPDLRTIPVTAIPCSAQQSQCGETCIDIMSDPSNCGACGRVCSDATRTNVQNYGCSGGKCIILSCEAGYSDCAHKGYTDINYDGCETNLMTGSKGKWETGSSTWIYQTKDPLKTNYIYRPLDCGSCGNACDSSKLSSYFPICENSACKNVCRGVWLDCNNNPADGCEQDFDNNNCGACGAKCPAGYICGGGCCYKQEQQKDGSVWGSECVADSLGGKDRGSWQMVVTT